MQVYGTRKCPRVACLSLVTRLQ